MKSQHIYGVDLYTSIIIDVTINFEWRKKRYSLQKNNFFSTSLVFSASSSIFSVSLFSAFFLFPSQKQNHFALSTSSVQLFKEREVCIYVSVSVFKDIYQSVKFNIESDFLPWTETEKKKNLNFFPCKHLCSHLSFDEWNTAIWMEQFFSFCSFLSQLSYYISLTLYFCDSFFFLFLFYFFSPAFVKLLCTTNFISPHARQCQRKNSTHNRRALQTYTCHGERERENGSVGDECQI